ncbi:hypothetical protein IFM89_012816 [Coptis chinensis]|nr:hypothetical protein IFM89_012816 [Coptis chinensis]
MKVKTSASDFRALVQELTGQDSDIGDASRYSSEMEGINEGVVLGTVPSEGMEISNDREEVVQHVPGVEPYGETIRTLDSTFEQFEPFDRVFSPFMIENFNGLIPSGLLHDICQPVEKP